MWLQCLHLKDCFQFMCTCSPFQDAATNNFCSKIPVFYTTRAQITWRLNQPIKTGLSISTFITRIILKLAPPTEGVEMTIIEARNRSYIN